MAIVTAVLAGCTTPGQPGPAVVVALGDSITSGFDSCTLLTDCRERSWSTGYASGAESHYRRLLTKNPAVRGYNLAQPMVRAESLAGQARTAVALKADYVTVLVGANDACAPTVDTMTPVATFKAQVDAALDTIELGRPTARVLVASVPDLMRLWQVTKDVPLARGIWSAVSLCQSMLARPEATTLADNLRRLAVRARVQEYNTALAQVCAEHRGCRYDGGATFRYPFTLGEISTFDYFHPNITGQAALSRLTWAYSGY